MDLKKIIATYPGGDNALNRLFSKKMKYPRKAKKDKTEGQVVVVCVIDTLDYTRNIRVIKGVRSDLDEEAKRSAGL